MDKNIAQSTKDNPKIKIYVSCHKECFVPENPLLYPIQVGTALASKRFENMLHDNEGDNISTFNKSYCELTAQYWAWKNDDADFYGFFHYRRYLSFNPVQLECDSYGNIIYEYFDEQAEKQLHLDPIIMQNIISQNDVITVKPLDITSFGGTVYAHYKSSPYHSVSDLDTAIKIIQKKFPHFNHAINTYINSSEAYFCNMFILRKDIFLQYNNWLFSILDEHKKLCDYKHYSIDEIRIIGFLAERLWGIYYTYLQEKGIYKTLELQRSLFKNTDKDIILKPAFPKNNIPILLSSDNNFVPYAAVLIQSIAFNSNENSNYDIVILEQNISDYNKNKLKTNFGTYKNFSIRFKNVKSKIKEIQFYTPDHFKIETYFRLLAPEIFQYYKKMIYIDVDLVVNRDLTELYNIDLGPSLLGAAIDVDCAALYKCVDQNRKTYTKNILKLKNPYEYFQAGVLILNLEEFRKNFTTKYLLDLAASQKWQYVDQDVLNFLCQGRIKYIPLNWNIPFNWTKENESRIKIVRQGPKEIYELYMEAKKDPYIIHYAGFLKPWFAPENEDSEWFWRYARMSTYYETILARLNKHMISEFYSASNSALLAPMTDACGISINGVNEIVYADGMYVKLINKLNKWFPKGTRKRSIIKKIFSIFIH